MARLLSICLWGASIATLLGGCTLVLGLDPPTLAPCADPNPLCIDAGAGDDGRTDENPSPGDAPLADGSNPDVLSPFDGSADERVDQSPGDAPSTDSTDVGPARDGGSGDSGVLILCSFLSAGSAVYCDTRSATPLCCETGDDAGSPLFGCVAEGGCPGYPIECANNQDCVGNAICCHHTTGMKCEAPTGPASTCETGTQACDPGNPGECPESTTCQQQLVNGGLDSPYLGCQ